MHNSDRTQTSIFPSCLQCSLDMNSQALIEREDCISTGNSRSPRFQENVQIVVNYCEKDGMAVVNMYFKKREGHRMTYKSGRRCRQMHEVQSERDKLMSGENVKAC